MPADLTTSTSISNLTPTSGWFDRSRRIRLEIGGPDRAKFLHNLTTNDVKRLAIGTGQESFVTTLQGKTLAYITLLATDVNLFLRTEAASIEGLAPHLAKYGVFDDVLINDVSSGTSEIHVFGPEVESLLRAEGVSLPAETALAHVSGHFAGEPTLIVRESPTGQPGFTIIAGIEAAPSIQAKLREIGLSEVEAPLFESLRIEAGTPLSGRDVTLANLPQEVGRDSKTINFVKGCYLGQETVARLDALGHVNRIFRGLTFEGSTKVPPDGSTLMFEGKPAGAITSATLSAARGFPIALGYIKVGQAVEGTRLSLSMEGEDPVEAIVRELPRSLV